MRSLARLLGAAGTGACVLSCAGAPDGGDPFHREQAALSPTPRAPANGALLTVIARSTGTQRVCAGTLVAPNVLVTALTCVSQSQHEGDYYCDTDGSVLQPDDGSAWLAPPVEAGNISVYAAGTTVVPLAYGAEVFSSGSPSLCVDNIAVVILDRDVPNELRPLRLKREMERGELVTLIGIEGELGLREHEPVLTVGPDETATRKPLFTVRAFGTRGGPCWYNLGAGVISEETGALVGVFSRTVLDECNSDDAFGVYTKVAPYAKLIVRAFARTGRIPLEESGSPPAPQAGCSLAATPVSEGALGWTLMLSNLVFCALWRRARGGRRRMNLAKGALVAAVVLAHAGCSLEESGRGTGGSGAAGGRSGAGTTAGDASISEVAAGGAAGEGGYGPGSAYWEKCAMLCARYVDLHCSGDGGSIGAGGEGGEAQAGNEPIEAWPGCTRQVCDLDDSWNWCPARNEILIDCMLSQPLENLMCNEGHASNGFNICVPEVLAYLECLP